VRCADEGGSASVCLIGVAAVVVAVGLAAALAGAATTARHRAQAAADLGALAGARYAVAGQETACGRAAAIIASNGARMAGCRLDVLDLVVTAEVPVSGAPAGLGPARASARAGPARSTPTA
jgi:secretion/DNA translocation related TadE-like protein